MVRYIHYMFTLCCDRYFLLARSDPTAETGKAFTAFVIERDTPGITPGRKVMIIDTLLQLRIL